jgi:hypothetical protein
MVAALAFSSCVGTIYDRTYSYQKNYYKPAKDKKEVSAEAIMGVMDKKQPDANALLDNGAPGAGAPAGLPPADGGVPGLPPPGAPDAGAPAAGAPGAAPAAGAIPGLPPATPPAAGTPPPPPK